MAPPTPTRRQTLQLAAMALAPAALTGCSTPGPTAGQAPTAVREATERFARLAPEGSAVAVQASPRTGEWRISHQSDRPRFVGSAVKTFIVAQYLRDVEDRRGGLALDAPCTVGDAQRSPGSPVFGALSGLTRCSSVLEAMIAHSDNTATDIALAQVGAERVRALIREAGLVQTRIPDSTRHLFSYLAGAPLGTDLGWAGMQALAQDGLPGLRARHDVINPHQSMLSTADELVQWYRDSLAGRFFRTPQSLLEYQRIHAMADALWMTLPATTPAFGKGGSLDWEGFHCLSLAGQMQVQGAPASFCFLLNWQGGPSSVERTPAFIAAARQVLEATARAMGG